MIMPLHALHAVKINCSLDDVITNTSVIFADQRTRPTSTIYITSMLVCYCLNVIAYRLVPGVGVTFHYWLNRNYESLPF